MTEPREGGARGSVTVWAQHSSQFLLNPKYFIHMIFNMCDILVQKVSEVFWCEMLWCECLPRFANISPVSRHTATSDLTCHVTPRTHLLRSLSYQILIPHKCRNRFGIFFVCEKLNILERFRVDRELGIAIKSLSRPWLQISINEAKQIYNLYCQVSCGKNYWNISTFHDRTWHHDMTYLA